MPSVPRSNSFVSRLEAANKRIEELKNTLIESRAFNEVTSAYALDLCAIKAVEQGHTQNELTETQNQFRLEMQDHANTRRILKETQESLDVMTTKFEELKKLYSADTCPGPRSQT